MKILSAHYALAPNGALVKNPLLYVHDNGEIERLDSCGPIYKETHGAQFFSGLLIPGFLCDMRMLWAETERPHNWQKEIFAAFSKGSQYITLPASASSLMPDQLPNGPAFIFDDAPKVYPLDTCNAIPWFLMIKHATEYTECAITDLLDLYLCDPWKKYLHLNKGGLFKKGFYPGVWCITGIDWQTMKLTPQASLKRLTI